MEFSSPLFPLVEDVPEPFVPIFPLVEDAIRLIFSWLTLADLVAMAGVNRMGRKLIGGEARYRALEESRLEAPVHPLLGACRLGKLEVVQYAERDGDRVYRQLDLYFSTACHGQHLKLAQWLHEKRSALCPPLGSLQKAVEKGNLPMLQWLVSIEIPLCFWNQRNQLFQLACSHGHLLVAQWLATNGRSLDGRPIDLSREFHAALNHTH